jgi:hypothetical protein
VVRPADAGRLMARTSKRGGSSSERPLRVLGYVRCSLEEQAASGAGLAAQRKAIREACTARGYELAEILEDAGWSGKSLDRPGISTALERLDTREADALMVAKLDRLSRSLLDFAQVDGQGAEQASDDRRSRPGCGHVDPSRRDDRQRAGDVQPVRAAV